MPSQSSFGFASVVQAAVDKDSATSGTGGSGSQHTFASKNDRALNNLTERDFELLGKPLLPSGNVDMSDKTLDEARNQKIVDEMNKFTIQTDGTEFPSGAKVLTECRKAYNLPGGSSQYMSGGHAFDNVFATRTQGGRERWTDIIAGQWRQNMDPLAAQVEGRLLFPSELE